MYESGQLLVLNMQDILPNRFQPRIRFDEQKLNELAESIRKYGVIQPIVVRQIGNKYEIIAGERRYKASQIANRESIPAIIINLSDKDSEEIALLENVQRQELTPIEEAVSYKRILDMGYITQEGLAQKLGKSQSTIANKIRLLNLDDHAQDALLHGKISERHARSLLRIVSKSHQVTMLNRIMKERLTVKKTDEEINKLLASQPNEGQQHVVQPVRTIPVTQTENLFTEQPRRAVPVASHEIIRVKPPKEFEEQKKQTFNNTERRQGFMDIDKIMKEAQDINQVTQPNDISDLMKQGGSTPNPAPTQTSEQEVNKFVNFNGMVREVESEQPAQPQPQGNVSFDSIFNQQPARVEPAPVEQVQIPEPAQPVQPQIPVEQAPSPEQPVQIPEPIQQPVQPQIPVQPVQEPVYQREQQVQRVTVPAQPQIQPVPAQPVYAAPLQQYQQPINNVPETDIIETPGYNQNMQAEMPSQQQVEAARQAQNFRQALNLIRSCADKIEDLGFYIDLDEIDMGNNYQVTFKINKE